MMNRKLSMAWERWQQWYAELKDQQFRLAGALRRMMNRQLSMAWESWQEWYADLMEQRRKLAHALARLMHRKLAMAWITWVSNCQTPEPAPVSAPLVAPLVSVCAYFLRLRLGDTRGTLDRCCGCRCRPS